MVPPPRPPGTFVPWRAREFVVVLDTPSYSRRGPNGDVGWQGTGESNTAGVSVWSADRLPRASPIWHVCMAIVAQKLAQQSLSPEGIQTLRSEATYVGCLCAWIDMMKLEHPGG
jgi:hypothetical protein